MKRIAAFWSIGVALAFAAALSFANAETPATKTAAKTDGLAKATFAGGCFWCMEPPFDKTEGVVATISGYAGGDEVDPTYREVASGKTGHAEVVQVLFDPERVSYETLLHIFWRNVDPLTADRQFCDGGRQYRTAIYAHGDEQLAAARASLKALETEERFDAPIVTEVEQVGAFYPAEDYHQDYYQKNPIRYRFYRRGCGRDARLATLWGAEAGGLAKK